MCVFTPLFYYVVCKLSLVGDTEKLPTLEEREQLLHDYAKRSPIPIQANLRSLATKTQEWSGRDLREKLIKVSIHRAILTDDPEIPQKTLEKLIENKNASESSPRHYS